MYPKIKSCWHATDGRQLCLHSQVVRHTFHCATLTFFVCVFYFGNLFLFIIALKHRSESLFPCSRLWSYYCSSAGEWRRYWWLNSRYVEPQKRNGTPCSLNSNVKVCFFLMLLLQTVLKLWNLPWNGNDLFNPQSIKGQLRCWSQMKRLGAWINRPRPDFWPPPLTKVSWSVF